MDAKTKAADRQPQTHGWRPERCDRVALVLQGGGALGAYQVGVYQALHEVGIEPDWVSGSRSAPSTRRSSPATARNAGCGGIVSNTPLQYLLEQEDDLNSLVFQVDLFSTRGALPRDLDDVMARHKDIMYSSRTREHSQSGYEDTKRTLRHKHWLEMPPDMHREAD